MSPTGPVAPAVSKQTPESADRFVARLYFWIGLLLVAAVELGLLLGRLDEGRWGSREGRFFLFGTGVALTSFLAAYLLATYRHTSRVEKLVKERTEQMQQINRRLEEMARLKDEFVALVSHELRTPLAIMKEGVAQLLDGLCGEITEDQRGTLAMTLRNIDRLKLLIEDLLDVSKIEAGKMPILRSAFDLCAAVQEAQQSFRNRLEEKGLKIETRLPSRCVRVEADRERILQVLAHLIGNAVKFTEEGSIRIALEDRAGAVVCSVEDTGPGIAPENVSKLFEKFQQFERAGKNGEKGTGLGLAICKGIVELHGGKIWAESTPGRGCRFFFTLPVARETVHA